MGLRHRRSSSAVRHVVLAGAILCGCDRLARAAEWYWDGNGAQAAGAGTTPSGAWGSAAAWNDQPDGGDGGGLGVIGPWVGGSVAVFCAGSDAVGNYTISLASTQSVGGIDVEEGNLTLSGGGGGGGTLDLGSGNVSIDVSGSASASVSAVVAGAGARLVKTGGGTLVLGTVLNTFNTFDAGVSVNGGVLEFPGEANGAGGQPNALGKAPASFVSDYIRLGGGATLRSARISTGSANFVLPNRGIQLGTGGGTLDIADPTPNNSLLYAGVISGTGPLTKAGPGTIQLQGVNTYSGDTFVTGGGLGLDATATLGNASGALHLDGNGAALVAFAARSDASAIANPIAISADAVVRNTSAQTSGVRTLPLGAAISASGGGGGSLTIRNVASGSAEFDVRVLADDFEFPRPLLIDRGSGAGTKAVLACVSSGDAGGSVTFSGGISGNGALVKDGPGTLVLGGVNSYTGDTIVAGGKLLVRQSLAGTATLSVQNSGVVELSPTGNGTNVVRAASVAVDPAAKIDLTDNKLITADAVGSATDGTYDGVSGLIQSGRIVSSSASGNLTSLGVAEAQQVKSLASSADTSVWAGQSVTGSDTLVMYTYGGDANLDGKINVDDYGRIDFNVNLPGVAGWYNGDFNYDGKINVDDYGIIDFNVGIQGPPFASTATQPLAVPEPAAVGVLVGVMGVTRAAWRTRRRRH